MDKYIDLLKKHYVAIGLILVLIFCALSFIQTLTKLAVYGGIAVAIIMIAKQVYDKWIK